ncbi:MAG: hypothetical protein HYT10_01360 [Candidatus Levybacteria bacterium]|nr:hypothetical protein [Candidatus Levybacteria bacterium]
MVSPQERPFLGDNSEVSHDPAWEEIISIAEHILGGARAVYKDKKRNPIGFSVSWSREEAETLRTPYLEIIIFPPSLIFLPDERKVLVEHNAVTRRVLQEVVPEILFLKEDSFSLRGIGPKGPAIATLSSYPPWRIRILSVEE